MAIDPSISLGIKPVQIADPLEQLGKVQNLIALRNQNAMAPLHQQAARQQLQTADLENQQREQAMTDDKAARDFFATSPNATPDEMIAKFGPKMAAPIIKSQYEAEEARLKTGKAKAEQFGQIAASIKDEDSFHRGVGDALSRKLIDGRAAMQLLQQGWNEQTAAQVQQIGQQSMTAIEQHDAALKDAKEKHDAIMRPLEVTDKKTQIAKAQMEIDDATRQRNATVLAAAAASGPDALRDALMKLPGDQRAPFSGVSTTSKPADILRIGMKPNEVASADTAAKNAENNVSEYELELRAAKGDKYAKAALANRQRDKIAQAQAGGAATRGLDREIAQYGKPFAEAAKGADGQLDKVLDAEKMLASGAVGQALGIPKILTALVSGQGSGVRITQAELNSIAKARGIGGDIEGFFNRIEGKGALTADQKQQAQALLSDVREKLVQKKVAANAVLDEMNAATDRAGVLAAEKKGRAGSMSTVHFTDSGVSYDIPADKAQAFLSSHPNAKKGN